jgi:hypothetical protein
MMPLTRWERKARLKHGAGRSIAKRCRRAESHVSEVIAGHRRDPVVEKEVARRMKLSVEEAFGPMPEREKAPEKAPVEEAPVPLTA